LTFLRILRLRFPNILLKRGMKKKLLLVSLALFFIGGALLILFTDVLGVYSEGKLTAPETQTTLTSVLNLGVSLARSAGILLPMVVLGIIGFSMIRNKGFVELFFIFTIMAMIPTFILRTYTGYYIIMFTSIFIAAGILFLSRIFNKKRKIAYVLTATMLVLSMSFSTYMMDYELKEHNYLSSDNFDSGLYVKYSTSGTILSNDGLTGSRIGAVASRPYLPIGGATNVFYGPEILAYDFFRAEELVIVQLPLEALTLTSDSPFELVNVQMQDDWFHIMETAGSLANEESVKRKGDNQTLFVRYNISYGLEIKALYLGFNHYGKHYSAGIYAYAHEMRYKVYEGEGEILWFLT
jgi:hypothetical protein